MGQSLAAAAVRGMTGIDVISEEHELLAKADIDGLIALKRSIFGGARMADDDDGDDGSDDGDDGDDDGDDGDDDGDDGDDDGDDEKDKLLLAARGEAKKYRLKNREHRNRIAELEKELATKGKKPAKKADDDGDDDADGATDSKESAKLQADNEKLARSNEDLLIRLEFTHLVTAPDAKVKFKNPATAMKLLDLSDVEITEDGTVEGLDEAIEALAKSDAYLLADKADKDDEDDDEDDKPKPRRKTGQPTGGRKKGNPSRDKLLSKYPALRR